MSGPGVSLEVQAQSWPTKGEWRISRGAVTSVETLVVALGAQGAVGHGECRPYARYGETMESVVAQIESLRDPLAQGLDREGLQAALAAGAARNALDCAFWDLQAKIAGRPVWDLIDLGEPKVLQTAYSLSLDTPENMARVAKEQAWRPLLKLKLAGEGDLERVAAVRANAPDSRLIVDANEGWTPQNYPDLATTLAELGVTLIEQPLPASEDAALESMPRPVQLAADESCHDRASLDSLKGRYDVVNIKLDKTGGLTEALALKTEAQAQGFGIMVGCMLASSLAMAPATLLAQGAEVVDLDGPLLLAEDCPNGLVYEGSEIMPVTPALWG